jgi:hypothetical protein
MAGAREQQAAFDKQMREFRGARLPPPGFSRSSRATLPTGGFPARGTIGQGVVRNLQWQVEAALHINACRFQIERRNAEGKPLPSVPVEMRSMSFKGTLSNGDWVEVLEPWVPGQILRPHRIMNLTTKAPFKSTYGVVNQLQAFPILYRHPRATVAALVSVVAVVVVLFVGLLSSGPSALSTGPNSLNSVSGAWNPQHHAAFRLSKSLAAPNTVTGATLAGETQNLMQQAQRLMRQTTGG